MKPHPEFPGIILYSDEELKKIMSEASRNEKREMPKEGICACRALLDDMEHAQKGSIDEHDITSLSNLRVSSY